MSRTQRPAERRTAGSGKGASSAETGLAGSDEIAASGAAVAVAGGNDASLASVLDFGANQGVAGGTAAPTALAAASGQAAVAGGEGPAAALSAPTGQAAVAGGEGPAAALSTPTGQPAVAGGDGTGAALSAPAAAGGDATAVGAEGPGAHAGGDAALRRGLPTFHVLGPRDHVMTDAAIPGLGDVGNNPNYIRRGSTAHFIVFYDSALGSAGASAADAVLGKCEADFNTLRGWFSNTTPGSLPFNIYITTDTNGASHASCSSTTLYLGAKSTNPINNAFVLQLLIAEEDEVFEAAFGHGWDCGASNGEGLSRVLANDLYPGVEPANFVSSSSWLDAPGRPDWINNTEGTDQDYVSIGCSVLFLNWMRFQLGYSWTQIIAAGNSTLAKTYQNLTGQTDGYALFMALMDLTYPRGTPSGLTTDNPFPLSDVSYTAVFRPGSGAEWVVAAQPWSAMFNTVNGYIKQGLYAQALNIVADDNTILYSAVFRPGSGTEWVVPAQPWSAMFNTINGYIKQGLYVTALGIAEFGNEVLYSAVFRPGSGVEWVAPAQPWSAMFNTINGYIKQGLYVDSIAATIQNGVVLYSAVFRPGSGTEWVVPAQPWSSFATNVNNYLKQGLYATAIAVVESSSGPLYTAVFRPGPGGAEWVLGNYLWKDFAKQIDAYLAQDLYATGIAACRLAV